MNCPNCQAELLEGANTCSACGHVIGEGPGVPEAPAEVTPTPAPPPGRAAPSMTVSLDALTSAGERWGVVTPLWLLAAAALAALAILIVTIAHIAYLVADDGLEQAHAAIWQVFASVLVLGCVGALFLARAEAEGKGTRFESTDLGIAVGLSAATGLFALISLVLGLDDRFDAMDSWGSFAQVWAFAALACLLVSRPVPPEWPMRRGEVVGLGLFAGAAFSALIGVATGMGDDFGAFTSGATWLTLATVLAILGVGWLAGVRSPTPAA